MRHSDLWLDLVYQAKTWGNLALVWGGMVVSLQNLSAFALVLTTCYTGASLFFLIRRELFSKRKRRRRTDRPSRLPPQPPSKEI